MSEESTMTGSGRNPWMDALQRQQDMQRMADEAERAARTEGEANENGMLFNDWVQTHLRNKENQRKRNRRGAAALLSAFKIGAYNGGDLPDDLLPTIGDALGYDGKTRQLGRVHVNDQGDVILFTSRTDPKGSVVEDKPTVIPFKDVYGTALENQGILTRDEMMLLRNGSKNYQKLTEDVANRELPPVPDDYGKFRTPVGERTQDGGISVPGWWLYGPQRRMNISAFGANGRGGFTNYDSNEQTGYQLAQRDSGTRAEGDKGRWKVLSRGADPNSDDGTQVTRYENDKTGEVVSVRDGETPPWESRAVGEKERIARINADGKIKAAEKANETKMNLAEAANALKQYGIDVSAQLKERGLDIQQQNADERSAHNQAVESQQAENEKGRNERAKQANELKTKMAEMKSRGTIGGRPPTTHEYVEALRFANDLLNDEADRNAMREHAKRIEESLKQRGEKIPEVAPPSGKTEVKKGDNGARETKKDSSGVEWKIIRDVNGKPVGKMRIN